MTKNLQIALVVLIILIGIFFLNRNSQLKYNSTSEAIFTHNVKDIFKFMIQKGDEVVELTRRDTLWSIDGNDTLEINSRSMDNMFNQVLQVKWESWRTNKPERYGKYSVDDSTGIKLVLFGSNNDTIANYIFGPSDLDRFRSYVRIGDDPKVYLADQNVTYMLSTRATYWGEKPKEEFPPPIPEVPLDTSIVPADTIIN